MIGLYVKIPFHAQIRRADRNLAAELSGFVVQVAERFMARMMPSDESFLLLFEEGGGCAMLRAADAARALRSALVALAPRLHGWTILLDRTEGPAAPENLLRGLRDRWYEIERDGFFAGPGIGDPVASYLDLDKGPGPHEVEGFPYAEPSLPAGYSPPTNSDPSLGRFIDQAGEHVIGESDARFLLAVGPGSAPENLIRAALAALYRDDSASFLWFHAGMGEASPYGPVLRGLASPPAKADPGLLPGPDRQALEALAPVVDFLRASPYRSSYSAAIRTRFKLYVAARMRLYAKACRLAGLPPIIILAGIDRFPAPGLELACDLLEEGLGTEGLIVFGTAEGPFEGLPGATVRIVAAPPPAPLGHGRGGHARRRTHRQAGHRPGPRGHGRGRRLPPGPGPPPWRLRRTPGHPPRNDSPCRGGPRDTAARILRPPRGPSPSRPMCSTTRDSMIS